MPALYLSLGSSLGDRPAVLADAIRELRREGLQIDRVSSLHETEPVGSAAGPGWFLNLAAAGETELEPEPLLELCLRIERAIGGPRAVPGGPRVLDIDLLMLGDCVREGPACEVPHPRLAARRFVLEPLAEIAPDARHPVTGLSVAQMLERLDDPARVIRRGPFPSAARAAGVTG